MSLWLVKNGIPYDLVHLMEDWELFAHTIVFSQFENGEEFDWDTMSFVKRR